MSLTKVAKFLTKLKTDSLILRYGKPKPLKAFFR